MSLHLYQIIVSTISVIMIYSGIKNFITKKTGQTFYKLSVRIFVWGGMALIALFPQFTNIFAHMIGLEGNINAVILTGFLLIFLMIFKLLSAIERLEQQMTEVIRKDAINNSKLNK